jgi:hypothetical protein
MALKPGDLLCCCKCNFEYTACYSLRRNAIGKLISDNKINTICPKCGENDFKRIRREKTLR